MKQRAGQAKGSLLTPSSTTLFTAAVLDIATASSCGNIPVVAQKVPVAGPLRLVQQLASEVAVMLHPMNITFLAIYGILWRMGNVTACSQHNPRPRCLANEIHEDPEAEIASPSADLNSSPALLWTSKQHREDQVLPTSIRFDVHPIAAL